MPARSLTCETCGRTLGTVSRKRDHRGNPYDKLRLSDNVLGRLRGRGVLCAITARRLVETAIYA